MQGLIDVPAHWKNTFYPTSAKILYKMPSCQACWNKACYGAVQLDIAGLLFLLVIAGTSIVMGPTHSAAALQWSWLACLMHVLPLATMAINLRWYAPLYVILTLEHSCTSLPSHLLCALLL